MGDFRGLKNYWHDIYYALAPKSGVTFAMTCKDVTAKIDLDEIPKQPLARMRFWLHISLCHACKNYLQLSRALSQALKTFSKKNHPTVDLDGLNQSLLNKFSKKED